MNPRLSTISTQSSNVLNEIVSCVSNIECSSFFMGHLGKSQGDQKIIVNSFQDKVITELSIYLPAINWQTEYSPNQARRDSIDIYGEGDGFVVAIELDKNRADQVAKKFVSRMALLPNKKIYFISLCYPGTAKMNKPECVKYFGYCSGLATRMGNEYAGILVE